MTGNDIQIQNVKEMTSSLVFFSKLHNYLTQFYGMRTASERLIHFILRPLFIPLEYLSN